MGKLIVLIVFVGFLSDSFGQNIVLSDSLSAKFSKLEMEIVHLLKIDEDIDQMYEARTNAEEKLTVFLKIDSSFYHPLDSLKQYSALRISEDQSIRTIGWDLVTGGNWHDYATYIQSSSHHLNLNPVDCGEIGCYNDAAIYKIFSIKIQNKDYYMVFAYGTHGSGHHHKTVRVFYLDEGRIVQHPTFMNGDNVLEIVCARRDKAELEYDDKSNILSHNAFIMDNEIGFAKPTGKIIKYKLGKKGFKIQ